MEISDQELLMRFARRRSEEAFSLLVKRHLPMVYGVASRVTGCPSLAEEVAQSTFAKLAHQAKKIDNNVVIGGWLYNTARNGALSSARSERRRRQREKCTTEVNSNDSDQPFIKEHLEEAMSQLKEEDRSALVLRFFEDRNLREVGCELGISEDAARMRINRALEKLKSCFGQLGISGSVAWFASAIPNTLGATIPAGLSASITSSVFAGSVTVGSVAAVVSEPLMNYTMNTFMNLKTASAIIAAATITGTATYMTKENQLETLRNRFDKVSSAYSQVENQQIEAKNKLNQKDRQIVRLEGNIADIHRLRGEVDRLNGNLATMNAIRIENDRLHAEVESLGKHIAEQRQTVEDLSDHELKDLPNVRFGSFVDAAGNISEDRSNQSTFAFENPGPSRFVYAFHQPGTPLDKATATPRETLITVQPNSTNYVVLPVSQTETTTLNVKLMKVTSSSEMTVSVP